MVQHVYRAVVDQLDRTLLRSRRKNRRGLQLKKQLKKSDYEQRRKLERLKKRERLRLGKLP